MTKIFDEGAEPQTTEEIAKETHLPTWLTLKVLRWLENHGLVLTDPTGYWLPTDAGKRLYERFHTKVRFHRKEKV